MTESTAKRTRTDYRTGVPGTLKFHLLNGLPAGQAFKASVGDWHTQLHNTERDTCGNYVNLDGAGRPELTQQFLDELNGIPPLVFLRAVEHIKSEEYGDPEGAVDIRILEWHQRRFGKPSRHKFAADLGIHETSLGYRLNRAVTRIREVLPFEVQVMVAETERKTRGEAA